MLAALAALGALLIHQLAYLLATLFTSLPTGVNADHGHLGTQWALVTPFAVLAASVFVLRQVRNLHLGRGLQRLPLATLSGSMFLGQELVETHLGGDNPLTVLTHPAALIGLALAPLVAITISHLLAEASELVARFLRQTTPMNGRRAPVPPRPAGDAAPSLCDLSGTPSRGPPVVRHYSTTNH